MAVDPSGDVYVTGYIAAGDAISALQSSSIPTATGWESRYFYISNDKPSALAVDLYGNAYITGRSWNGADYDCFTIKYRDSDDMHSGLHVTLVRVTHDEMALAITVDPMVTLISQGIMAVGSLISSMTQRHTTVGSRLWLFLQRPCEYANLQWALWQCLCRWQPGYS